MPWGLLVSSGWLYTLFCRIHPFCGFVVRETRIGIRLDKSRCDFGGCGNNVSPIWTPQEINYDSPRGGVSVITEKGEITTSYLLIQRAQPADSGGYTCHPSNANTQTVAVHVLNGAYIYL